MFRLCISIFMACAIASGPSASAETESDTITEQKRFEGYAMASKESGVLRIIETLEKKVAELEPLAEEVAKLKRTSETRFVASRAYNINARSGYLAAGIITYDKDLLGLVGNYFNAATGKFVAPRSGIYQFTISAWCYAYSRSGCLFYIYKNGSVYQAIWDYEWISSGTAYMYSETMGMVALQLNTGDEIWASQAYSNVLYSGNTHPITFTGTLLMET